MSGEDNMRYSLAIANYELTTRHYMAAMRDKAECRRRGEPRGNTLAARL